MKNAHVFTVILLAFLGIRLLFFFGGKKNYEVRDKVRITAKVTSEPVRYDTAQYLKLQGFKIYLPLFPEINYGDSVVVEGSVSINSDGKGYKLNNPKLVDLKLAQGILYKFRKKLVEFYFSALPNPHSSLVAGVTIGSKASIPQDFWEDLKASGTAHVVVASGMNVTLVAKFLLEFLILFLSRRKALVLACLGVWGYTVLSGFDAPIIRAAVMGTLAFGAQEVGREYLAWRALLLSAGAMLFIRPEWSTDLGFILSFVATASLMLFEKKVRRLIAFVPSVIREDLSTSLAAQIGVAPILYFYFSQFNIFSPLINAVVLWTIVPVTMIGMSGGLIGLVVPVVGRGILLLSYPLTLWFVNIVKLAG